MYQLKRESWGAGRNTDDAQMKVKSQCGECLSKTNICSVFSKVDDQVARRKSLLGVRVRFTYKSKGQSHSHEAQKGILSLKHNQSVSTLSRE